MVVIHGPGIEHCFFAGFSKMLLWKRRLRVTPCACLHRALRRPDVLVLMGCFSLKVALLCNGRIRYIFLLVVHGSFLACLRLSAL